MVEHELIDFISDEIAYDRQERLSADEPLLDGALDSTDVLRLVVHVEDRYGVTIEDDELVPENFATIQALSDLIRRKNGLQ